MSSLSATQADGYYIPPQYLDSGAYKKKSVSQFNSGSTKGHNQFLQRSVVRFELPYDGFCKNKSCNVHVGRGTRFNAHKSHVDDYHSTKIWEFTMKCRACAVQKFIIRTDPKGRCFDYTMGIHKKVEEFDTVDAGTLGVVDTDRGNGIVPSSSLCHDSSSCHQRTAVDNNNNDKNNPLEKLETRRTGERKAMTERDAMQFLLTHNKSTMFDDASSNSALRSTYRNVRNAKRRRLRNAQDVGLGKGIELYDKDTIKMSPEDSLAFFRAEDGIKDNLSWERETKKFASIRTTSIFSDGSRRRKGLGQAIPTASSAHRSKQNRVEHAKFKNQTRDHNLTFSAHSDGDGNACHQDDTTMRGENEQVRALRLDANTMKSDGRIANLTKGNTTSESSNIVSSLLVLGEYDSDSN